MLLFFYIIPGIAPPIPGIAESDSGKSATAASVVKNTPAIGPPKKPVID